LEHFISDSSNKSRHVYHQFIAKLIELVQSNNIEISRLSIKILTNLRFLTEYADDYKKIDLIVLREIFGGRLFYEGINIIALMHPLRVFPHEVLRTLIAHLISGLIGDAKESEEEPDEKTLQHSVECFVALNELLAE
jgi:hypothetical protein